jgi:hypothetical protein
MTCNYHGGLDETDSNFNFFGHILQHAMGFQHEHQRWDRDNYIRVEYANMINGRGQRQNRQKLK